MKSKLLNLPPVALLVLLLAGPVPAPAQSSELEQLKAAMQAMQKNMEEMQKKIAELEREKAAAPAPAVTTNVVTLDKGSMSVETLQKIASGLEVSRASPIISRRSLNDQQEGAPRPDNVTLDPKYVGYIPVPNTPVIMKFNAKPRVDLTSDTRNSGNPDRFVTAQIPVKGQSAFGGSEQFNVNARGSQLRFDVRAPDMEGNFRFYYQNDFFGSGSGMQYRVQQLYGQLHNVTAGFTSSCFEDPDAWPDTVDYEGPNAVMFARRALVRYQIPFGNAWQLNLGVEAPGSEVDSGSTTNSISQSNSWPDGTMNVRWENEKRGHVQLGGVARSIGARGPVVGNQQVFGWGFNLATSLNVFKRDSFQAQLTCGEGIFRYFNDDFVNNDAAYNASGDLKAIPAFGVTAGYTHHWAERWRSTVTYGYVNLDNEPTQGPNAYHETHYASANLICQLRKHLSVGLEGLYGKKEVQSNSTGDVWRIQFGLVYAWFD